MQAIKKIKSLEKKNGFKTFEKNPSIFIKEKRELGFGRILSKTQNII
jgi:hypothetical protein